MQQLRWCVLVVLVACTAVEDPTEEESLQQAVSAAGPAGSTAVVPIRRASTWQYYDGSTDQGTGWRTYVPNTWREAPGPLGYGETYLATTIGFGNSSAKNPTAYFRQRFFVPNLPIRAAYLRVMYDDGFVFYLNGKEGGRAHMPSGPVTFNTLATGHEAQNRYVTYDISAQIPNLRTDNTLAIEVHQSSTTSSDLVFDAELILWIDDYARSSYEDGIPRGAEWNFWDQGGDLGTAWRAVGFDDHAWSAGPAPLGFGEPYIVTDTRNPITTYLRGDFTVGEVTSLVARVRYDDGFVMYLNGTEVARRAMPSGPVTASTLSTGHEASSYETIDLSAGIPLLDTDGMNVLAVELHQASAGSSDLVWDLELTTDGAWSAQSSGTTQALHDVFFTDASHGFVVGDGGTLRRTTDGGATWTAVDTHTTESIRDIDFVDAMNGWAVGAGGGVLRTHDGGASWTIGVITTELTGIDVTGPTHAWISANQDNVYEMVEENVFNVHDTGTGGAFEAIDMVDDTNGWIVGMVLAPDGSDNWTAIYHTADGGETWTQQWISGVHHYYLHDIEAIDAQTAWAVGQGSLSGTGEKKLVTHDGGATWTEAPFTDNASALNAVDFVDAQHGWAVGFYGSIVATDDGGATWHVQEQNRSFEKPWWLGVHFVDANNGWVVGEGGAIWHTTTGGWGD
jgi:photosystem II stability/assembly factor-like uncharacterized protein